MMFYLRFLLVCCAAMATTVLQAQGVTNPILSNQGDILPGCTDPEACNFNETAILDDGSCLYGLAEDLLNTSWMFVEVDCSDPSYIYGTDGEYYTFNEDGWIYLNGEQVMSFEGCGNVFYITANEAGGMGMYNPETGLIEYSEESGLCAMLFPEDFSGCTDDDAYNYHPAATTDDGSCLYWDPCDNLVDSNGVGHYFTNYYSQWNWIFQLDSGGDISFQEQSLTITSSNDDSGAVNPLTQVTIEADNSGTFEFDWYYSTSDEDWTYDIAYYINGERIDLVTEFDELGNPNQANDQFGHVSFFANAGDIIGFGIDATDNCCGAGVLEITNFQYPASCVEGCNDEMAINYSPDVDYGNWILCQFENPCGDIVSYTSSYLGFVGDYAFETWNQFSSNGSVDFSMSDDLSDLRMSIQDDEGNFVEASISHPVIESGRMILYYWMNYMDAPGAFSYRINNDPYISLPESGHLVLDLTAGDVLEFYATSVGDFYTDFEVGLSSFVRLVNCTPTCLDLTALNFNPTGGFDDPNACIYSNSCGQLVNQQGQGAGFSNDFEFEDWSIVSQGNGQVILDYDIISIFGNDNSGVSNAWTAASFVATVSGIYGFDWNYGTLDGPGYDMFGIQVDGAFTALTQEGETNFETTSQSGHYEVFVEAGSVVEIGINSTDDCCGLGWANVYSFIYPVDVCESGCTDPLACNFASYVTTDDGSCEFESCSGCLDEQSCNYNPFATIEGDCDFESCAGCMDPTACNFDPEAVLSGDCDFETCAGCTDETAMNYNDEATIDDGSCAYCLVPSVSFETDLCGTGTFTVYATVGSEGSGWPFEMTNNINDESVEITEQGTVLVGTFNEGDVVVFTITSAEFGVCTFTYEGVECPEGIAATDALVWNVFPNPAETEITMTGNFGNNAEVIVYNSMGQMVINKQMITSDVKTLHVGHLPAGVYHLSLVTENKVETKQVVIR